MGFHGPKTPFSFNFACTSGSYLWTKNVRPGLFRAQMDQRCIADTCTRSRPRTRERERDAFVFARMIFSIQSR